MKDLSHPNFDFYRNWIRDARSNNYSWVQIKSGEVSHFKHAEELINSLSSMSFKAPLTVEEWEELVDSLREHEESLDNIHKRSKSAIVTDSTQNNGSEIPTDSRSSWQLYRSELKAKGFKDLAIDEIEQSSVSILKRLNIDTAESGPVKGMVVGNVQSGKTSNMAGLMAMAADHGWNVFIVLSGLIENLRKQTQERLISDLNHPGNIHWQAIDNINAFASKTQNLLLGDENKAYLYVCLKNKKRLEGLIDWMQQDPNKYQQMKVLVIDDEADQGSINTADVKSEERKTINRLIVNLVEAKNKKGSMNYARPKSMNYISYTATPYANFLNEYSSESLYPRSFIKTLSTVNEYFGPKEIFGVEGMPAYQGLDIVREINEEDYMNVKSLQENEISSLPDSLKDSISWFLCSVAAMKINGYKKPISMMIHTSQKQQHHKAVADAVKAWLTHTDRAKLLRNCEKVWIRETSRFTYDSFVQSYPEYSGDHNKIFSYPDFKMIEASIVTLISEITHIPLGDDGRLNYHQHIHLCVDNCSNNGINEEGMFMRLAYPDSKQNEELGHATAFIIVGGATLSRGLTIDGLVSTYFLRSTVQADSLMQMGRWFGYRQKYELYPRIWMTDDTREKFEFLSTLEYELRESLQQYSVGNADPSLYGPRVKNTPSISWMKVTANNRQQSAVNVEFDYTGTNSQTIFFPNDEKKLKYNLDLTKEFLSRLGDPNKSEMNNNSYVFREVPFEKIAEEFLEKFYFHGKTRTFSSEELANFIAWISKMTEERKLKDWNIVMAGKGNVNQLDDSGSWNFNENGFAVGKVNRTKKHQGSDNDTINIGVLRAPSDLYADFKKADLSEEINEEMKNKHTDLQAIRESINLGNTPLMILYCIDRNSVFEGKGNDVRTDLNAPEDIIGISIRVPGIDSNRGVSYGGLQIKIPADNLKNKGGYEEE